MPAQDSAAARSLVETLSAWEHRLTGFFTTGLRGPLLAALIAFLAGLPCALLVPALDRDESRFAQASSQMVETGDYININYQDGPRHKKPVGIHWLQSLSVQATGGVEARNILQYRWPSLFGAALAAFACAWGASRLFGTHTGLKAGLLFGVSFLLSTEAFIAKTDAVLCGLITLMMAALAQIYVRTRDLERSLPRTERPRLLKERLIFWLAMSAAILVKGPIAPIVAAGALVMLGLWDRKWAWMRYLGFTWGLGLVLLICGPWAIAITITTDGAFWTGAVGKDLADKVNGGSEGHSGLPGYHLLLLPLTLFPANWLLGGAIQTGILRRHEAAIRFALAWFLPAFLVFELSPTKLPHYPLPAFAGLIWLCAASLDVPVKLWARIVNVVTGLIGGALMIATVVYGNHLFGSTLSLPFVYFTAIGALGMAGIGGVFLWRKHERAGLVFAIGAGIVAHISFISLVNALTPLWMSRQMQAALVTHQLDPRQGIAPGPVASLGYAEPSLVFALGTKTALLNEDAAGAVSALNDGRPVFVESRMETAFQQAAAQAGIIPQAITAVIGHNYSNGRDVRIVLYRNPAPVVAAAPELMITPAPADKR